MKPLSLALSFVVAGSFVLSGCDSRHPAPGAAERAATAAVVETPARAANPASTSAPVSDTTVPASEVKKTATDAKPTAKASDRKTDGTKLEVKRLVVSRGIEKREPKDPGSSFWKDDFDRLYAFVELANPEKGESQVVVSFVPPNGGAARGNVKLDVGASPRFRTWAYSRSVDQRGTWTAVVATADGKELARQSFEVL